jgi:transposase
MAAPGLLEPAKKALATLDREWDGLAALRDYPAVSLDNNAAERAMRRPLVERKNAHGSRNDDAARLAVRIWTVTATAELAGLNMLTYVTATLTPASATAASRWPGRNWKDSSPGQQTPPTCAPGLS